LLQKWDGNTEKRLVFCVLSNILAIFEPVVGDFKNIIQARGFSTVSLGGFEMVNQVTHLEA
jgi:hypothetical protein